MCGSVPGISRDEDFYFPELGSKLLDTPGSRGIFLHLLLQCSHFITFLAWRKQKLFIVAIAGKISPCASLVTGEQIDSLLVISGSWHLGRKGVVSADHHNHGAIILSISMALMTVNFLSHP